MTLSPTQGGDAIDAFRDASLGTVQDPDAFLGLDGHAAVSAGDPEDDDLTVTNNSSTHHMDVTVSTTNFTIENGGGSNREFNFELTPGETRQVVFFQEDGNQDDVEFTASLRDGTGPQVGRIELTRTVTIAAQTGTTYRIRNVNSGLYMTANVRGSPWSRNVVQEYLDGTDSTQEWQIVSNGDGTVRIQNQGPGNRVLGIRTWVSPDSVVPESWSGAADQRWHLDVDGQGRYTIRSADPTYTDTYVADVEGDSTSPDADVIVWEEEPLDDPDPDNQRWVFEAV